MPNAIYGNGTNSTNGPNGITHFYDRVGIKAANVRNIYGQWADKRSMPKQMGKTFKATVHRNIYDRTLTDPEFAAKGFISARTAETVSASIAVAALGEGAGSVNHIHNSTILIETQLARYGQMTPYTDEVELFSSRPMRVQIHEDLGAAANRVSEDLVQMSMLATPTALYAGSATSISTLGAVSATGADDAEYKVTYDLMRQAVRKLVRNHAPKNKHIIVGSNKIGTKPIAQSYYAIVDADTKGDLESLTRGTGYSEEFVYNPAHTYGSIETLAEGEVGSMHDVRFIESETAIIDAGAGAIVPTNYTGTLGYTNVAGVDRFDVHTILFPTEGAFATVGLKGQGKIKFNSGAPGEVSVTNPYGTQGFDSYNFFYAGIILREERLLKVLVNASA